MNNQEPQNQSKITEEANVQNRRRFIKSAAAATPVVLTLASPSVLGGELCLSQQLSGNASGHPGNCLKGKPPSFWRDPTNKGSWPAPLLYGTGTSTTSCSAGYTGGTRFNSSNAFNTGTGVIMRTLLCSDSTLMLPTSIWIAALLNSSVPGSNYVLSKQQVLDLYNFVIAPPSTFDNNAQGRLDFLVTTW